VSVGGAPLPQTDPDDPDPRVRGASRVETMGRPQTDPDDPDPRQRGNHKPPPSKGKRPRKHKKAARGDGPAARHH